MAFPSIDPSAFGQMGLPQSIDMPAAQPGGGMFGGGHNWRAALLAALAGFNARRSPGVSSTVINNLQDAQTLKERMALQAQEHQQAIQDQIAVHNANRDYDISHAPPPDIQDRINVLNGVQPGLGDKYAQQYAAQGGSAGPMLVNPVTGQPMMPASKAPTQEPPAEAVARLKANPSEAAQFDEIFGPGSSAKFLGGPTPQASGGFPR